MVAVAAVALVSTIASAQPASVIWSPPIPGTVVQQTSVGFNGETGAAQWHAVASKKLVGSGNGQSFYQWYLSIYAPRNGAYRLRYQSPRNGAPLAHVERANGAKMWFPVQSVRIVGTATLMHAGAQQLVVQSQEMAADCGSAAVTVFATKPGGSVGPIATIANSCDLAAAISSDGTSIVLTGPYYKADAPLCCPTKAKVTATLRYANGKWSETPNYFKIQ
jgi:hypothetical protein